MRRFLVLAALLAGLGRPEVLAAADDAAFDFITHTEVHIAASPSQVWPHLRNVNAWKLGARARPFDGGVDAVGERFKVSSEGDDSSFYFIQTVELEPGRRWTIRLDGPEGELRGYATWTLAPEPGGTRLAYDVFVRSRAAAGTPPADVPRVAQRANLEAAKRMEAEFSRLKLLAEAK